MLLVIGAAVVAVSNRDGQNSDGTKSIFDIFNDGKPLPYNERVVKTFLPESGTAFKYNSPLLKDGYLYAGTSMRTGYSAEGPGQARIEDLPDQYFYKFDLDFNVVWKYPLHKRMVTGGAVMDTDGNLYFIAELVTKNSSFSPEQAKEQKEKEYFSSLSLVSLDGNGSFRWEKPVSENTEWNRGMTAPAMSADNIIYLGHERFFAFDTSGNLLGQYPDAGKKIKGYGGAPVIDAAGNVYFTAPEPIDSKQEYNTDTVKAYKFTPKLASLAWATEMGNETMSEVDPNYFPRKGNAVESTPALGLGGRSLYGITGCTISKIDTATGKLVWATKPEGVIGFFNASPAVDAEDNVYVGSKSNEYSKFFAIKSDGTLLWRKDIGADLYSSPILGDDNTVYVGSETLPNGKFHALDRLTGEEKWAIGTKEEQTIPDFSFCGMLLDNGYVYVGVHSAEYDNGDGIRTYIPVLFKIKVDAKGYLPGAAWPRMHGSNDNSGRVE